VFCLSLNRRKRAKERQDGDGEHATMKYFIIYCGCCDKRALTKFIELTLHFGDLQRFAILDAGLIAYLRMTGLSAQHINTFTCPRCTTPLIPPAHLWTMCACHVTRRR
jgi:hypothetical protein